MRQKRLTKSECRDLSKTLPWGAYVQMFTSVIANNKRIDWKRRSRGNKGITTGAMWNIFFPLFDRRKVGIESIEKLSSITKMGALREFGEYLPGEYYEGIPKTCSTTEPVHADPKFD